MSYFHSPDTFLLSQVGFCRGPEMRIRVQVTYWGSRTDDRQKPRRGWLQTQTLEGTEGSSEVYLCPGWGHWAFRLPMPPRPCLPLEKGQVGVGGKTGCKPRHSRASVREGNANWVPGTELWEANHTEVCVGGWVGGGVEQEEWKRGLRTLGGVTCRSHLLPTWCFMGDHREGHTFISTCLNLDYLS